MNNGKNAKVAYGVSMVPQPGYVTDETPIDCENEEEKNDVVRQLNNIGGPFANLKIEKFIDGKLVSTIRMVDGKEVNS